VGRRSEENHAVLIDLDGTLLDTFEGITKSVIFTLEKIGMTAPAPEDLTWIIGPPLEASFAKLIGSIDPKQIDLCMNHYRERYEKIGIYESVVYPGIQHALEELSQVCDLYLATAKPHQYGREALRHHGLLEYFREVHGSEFDGARAEKSELIAYILERERIQPSNAIMIGDRKYDILGAKANGVLGIGVTWGYGTSEELIEAGARLLAGKADELPELQEELSLRRSLVL
jgi:phosphoglycolate phosphatase